MKNAEGWVTCWACGKRGYPTRKAAKQSKYRMHDTRLTIYMCPDGGNNYHLGHLDVLIMDGKIDRGTFYNHAERRAG